VENTNSCIERAC